MTPFSPIPPGIVSKPICRAYQAPSRASPICPPSPGAVGLRALNTARSFAKPRVRESLQRLIDASEVVDEFSRQVTKFKDHVEGLGWPLTNGAQANAPYDVVADYMRGATGAMKDMYRHKERMLACINQIYGYIERQILENAAASGNPVVMLATHWAPDAFMSDKQFREFWWPPFQKLLLSLIAHDLIPMVLWEHDCTKRLEVIKDVPAGKCIYWFERTDMVKAFEALGDRVALRGGLSASLVTTGTPEQIDVTVKHLVENVWRRGGNLILDIGTPLPEETPIENVRAIYASARKYTG